MLTDLLKRRIKAQYPRLCSFRSLHPRNFGIAYLSLCHFVDTQKFVSAWTGPLYERNRYEIELDITYSCNLKCFGCNRCCGIAPSDDCLSLEQIRKFIRESTARGVPWKAIKVVGGEPTMHPQFLLIIEELLTFKALQCPEVTIHVFSNGFGKRVNDMLARVGSDVVVWNSAKNSHEYLFQTINLAPKDSIRIPVCRFFECLLGYPRLRHSP